MKLEIRTGLTLLKLLKWFETLLFLGRIYGIIVAGGIGSSVVDSLTGNHRIKKLPNVPDRIHGASMVAHNGTILLSGGRNTLRKNKESIKVKCGP